MGDGVLGVGDEADPAVALAFGLPLCLRRIGLLMRAGCPPAVLRISIPPIRGRSLAYVSPTLQYLGVGRPLREPGRGAQHKIGVYHFVHPDDHDLLDEPGRLLGLILGMLDDQLVLAGDHELGVQIPRQARS